LLNCIFSGFDLRRSDFRFDPSPAVRHIFSARAHGMWTYEPRQGRKAATVVCSASAVVTLAFKFTIYVDKTSPCSRKATHNLWLDIVSRKS